MISLSFTADKAFFEGDTCRLDVYAAKTQNVSRSRLKNGFKKLTVNGKEVRLAYKLSGGEKVELFYEDPVAEDIVPENIPLDIIYEDNSVTVVNKRQGMVTHPACGNWSGTLVNALLYHWKRDSICVESNHKPDVLRPGIVHRLDKDTSGIIITARTKETEDFLQKQFQERKTKKIYIAIVKGKPPYRTGDIKTQIVRDPKNRKRFTVSDDPSVGKFAWTKYCCFGTYGDYSLMKLCLKTGRTHQIRVHLKSIGCPILGDPIYSRKDSVFKDATLMLHARQLTIMLPDKKKPSVFEAPLPVRFKKVIRFLHEHSAKTLPPENPMKEKNAAL